MASPSFTVPTNDWSGLVKDPPEHECMCATSTCTEVDAQSQCTMRAVDGDENVGDRYLPNPLMHSKNDISLDGGMRGVSVRGWSHGPDSHSLDRS